MKLLKLVAGSLLMVSSIYAASTAACAGCHGQHFEKKAMGKSKVVKDMSKEEIIKALKGYKDGSYGGGMKAMMTGQVAKLSESDIEAIAGQIKGGAGHVSDKATAHAAASAVAAAKVLDINAKACDKTRISKEDLGKKKVVTELDLGLRKTDLYKESDTKPQATDYSRPAPGAAPRFERAYENAPPMIPHSVEGLLPITAKNNACLGCHMPDVAKSSGATPIPPTHFTDFRPTTVMKGDKVVKEGKVLGSELKNVSDIKLAKYKKLNHLYQGRFNCSQCHAPQAKVNTAVANTFQGGFKSDKEKQSSDLMDTMNEGVK